MWRHRVLAGLAVAGLAGPAPAEWTDEAELCATGYDIPEVIAACTTALQSGLLDASETQSTLNNRAWAHLEVRDTAAAMVDLNRAIKMDVMGGEAMAWNNLGRARWMEEDFAGAVDAFHRALAQLDLQGEDGVSTGPGTLIDATTNLAILQDEIGNAVEARRWTEAAFAIVPDHAEMQALYARFGLQ